MTRDELVATVESYSKRSDLTTEIETMFLPQAEARIGRDLTTRENEAQYDYPDTETDDRFLDVPSDYGRVRVLQSDQARGPLTLVSVDPMVINRYEQGGTPQVFTLRGSTIEVRPFTAGGTLTLYYWARPELPTGSSTNAVLTRYPQVYRYAVLAELHDWERDTERMIAAQQSYEREVRLVNRQASREGGNKPAMRRV